MDALSDGRNVELLSRVPMIGCRGAKRRRAPKYGEAIPPSETGEGS